MPRPSRQVDRTRRSLLDAFAQLLGSTAFDAITVAQVSDAADVSRQSFYRHFGDLDALTEAYFERIFDEFEDAASELDPAQGLSPYLALFRTLHHHRAELLGFASERLRPRLFGTLWAYQTRLQGYARKEGESEHGDVVIAYQSGGTSAVVMEWVTQGMTEPPEVIADMLAHVQAAFSDRQQFLPTVLAQHTARTQHP